MIEIQELVKIYAGGGAALKGVSLSIPPGMFGLLGPNGSGKSTLMKILAGLLEATAGSIRWDGEEVLGAPERVWPRLGYLPQDFGFYPNLTGRQMLLHILRLKGVQAPMGQARLCDALLERVNLTEAADRKTHTYSGGMRQRLGIAQAVAGDPTLVIVDEPTAGLDPEERVRFYRLLTELAHERTVLLSTHIVQDVETLCPRFAVIRAGRLVTQSTPAQARARLEGYTFEGFLDTRVAASLPDDVVVTREHMVEGRSAARLWSPRGWAPEGFAPSPPTLDDAYLLWMRGLGA